MSMIRKNKLKKISCIPSLLKFKAYAVDVKYLLAILEQEEMYFVCIPTTWQDQGQLHNSIPGAFREAHFQVFSRSLD